MTLGTYCKWWDAPERSEHLKCASRVIAEETPAWKGKPICVNANRSSMRCCKENEYSERISADISQERTGHTCPHCQEYIENNYPCDCRSRGIKNMGAPIPTMQRVNAAAISFNAEIEEMSRSLADGHRALGSFNTSVANWRNAIRSVPPIHQREYQQEIAGSWNVSAMDEDPAPLHRFNNVVPRFDVNSSELSDFIEKTSDGHCDHYVPNGDTCQNIMWCFKVFGTTLKCQAVTKDEVLPPQGDHRRLEVD